MTAGRTSLVGEVDREAFRSGFASFPVSLPFRPFGAMSDHQAAFYQGWISAAYTMFDGTDPRPWPAQPADSPSAG